MLTIFFDFSHDFGGMVGRFDPSCSESPHPQVLGGAVVTAYAIVAGCFTAPFDPPVGWEQHASDEINADLRD